MDSGTNEWWRRHGWTIALLLVAFGVAFGLRTIWTYPIIERWGALYTYAGGSDSFYHSRVMTYIIQTHTNLVYDPMLKFPVGAINPREPLFDWMNAILGILFAPFFGGNANTAGAFFLDLQAPLWAALQVFPIYLIGREVSGRRNGLIAALVYPFFSASINTSTFGYGDYQSFYTFFLLVVVYSFIRTVKAVGHRRYVESYRDRKQYVPALREFFRSERTAVKWAVFTGVAMGAFALSWQGYTYAIIVVVFTVLVAMLIERIRHVDSFGLYVSTWLIGLVAFPMAAPYYLVQHEIKIFLELPIILFFGTLLLLLPFLLLRDVPWVFSIPTLIAVVGAGVLALRFLTPALYTAAITGDGYFVKNLVYTTVAEAQAPSIDALIVGYGIVTFFLAFAGIALFAYQLAHQRFKRYLIAFLLFAVVSLYLPISATKFFLVAAPAYALLCAEAFHRLLDVGGYPQLRRSVASLTDRSGSLAAFRKSFKARHVLVLALAIGILLPNLWLSVDAGIPSNTKDQAAAQINQTIPSWLKLNHSAPGANYLGAAGSSLDTPALYDSAGYNWLAQQDTNLPEPQRPALVAWWDYGFQTIDQGQHPSVADNFQNGIDPAGQFLLAQNESLAIGVLATTLLQAEIGASHNPTLPPALNAILTSDGVNVTALHQYLDNEATDYALVVHNPQTYLPVNPSTITDDNAMYLATSYFLADHLSLPSIAHLYDTVESYTGWSIRYAMTDSRTFPFTGSDTGIFYAPADLTGRVINSQGVPTTFFNVTILGSDGTTYPLGPLPSGVSAVQYNINWSSPFYRTMLYRVYIGYNGTEAGQSGGIPGLSGAAAADRIEPGWMLQHFEVEYETAYACRGPNASPSGSCLAMNRPSAISVANTTHGTDNLTAGAYFLGGESILAYYPGVTLYGKVALPDGAPVPGARVTVYDGWGIPHMTNVTGPDGSFTLVLPPGNDTLNITYGTFDALNESDSNLISSVKLPISNSLGFDASAPSMVETFTVRNATVGGQVYWNVSGNKTFSPSTDPVVRGARVTLTESAGPSSITATTDSSGTFRLRDVPPGFYNVTVKVGSQTYNESSKNVSSGSTVNLSLGLSPGRLNGTVAVPSGAGYAGATVTLANATAVYETTESSVTGTFQFQGLAPGTYTVSAVGLEPSLMTNRVAVTIAGPGKSAEANLTMEPRGILQVELRANGVVLPNATVTIVPRVSFANATQSAVGAVLSAATNTTLATTNSQGVASAGVPMGYYAVDAVGRIGGRLYTATGSVNVTEAGSAPTLEMDLVPARPVTVAIPAPSSSSSQNVVVAYGPGGSEEIGWAAANGSAVLQLPSGTYTFLALSGATKARSTADVGITSANVSGTSSLSIPVASSYPAHFKVGTPLSGGRLYAAANAAVELSVGPTGPSIPAIADSNGSVGFYVPVTAPATSGGFCLRGSAFGFESNTTCGLSSASVANLGTFDLTVRPVNVTLQVLGLSPTTPVTAYITGESLGAENLTLTGLPTFSFPLTPGVYGIGAKAVIGGGSKVYLPSSVLSTTIPLGATYSNLTLVLVPEINATGKLALPPGLKLANVTVDLVSPLLNVTVNGTNFTTQFRATPANYTATVSGVVNGVRYVNVTRVTVVASNGTVLPQLVLSQPGVAMAVTLTKPGGSTLSANTTVTLVTPGGLVLRQAAVNGTFTTTVPPGTYRVYANVTVPTSGPNGTYFTNWSSGLSATCTATGGSSLCKVAMTGTVVVVQLHGLLVASGTTVPVPGTIRLVGPYPSANVTTVSASGGTFSAPLLPGAYFGYAASSGSPYLAGFGRLLVLPSTRANVTIAMEPTWNAAVHVGVANASSSIGGPVNVSVRDAFGDVVSFPGTSVGSTVALALPLGSYTAQATAPGSLNGVSGTAVASATFVVSTGNVVVTLGLAVPARATVAASVAGPGTVTVAAGGQASFAFTVRASGNEPVTIRPVGGPSGWSFNFSFANITLQPGANISGEVRIAIPPGTPVAHAPVSIDFDLPNGTSAGSVTPAPTVNVVGYYGVATGTSPSSPPSVGSTRAVLPFYVTNSGNVYEQVRLSVVDAPRLASYGWSSSWVVANATVASGLVNLTAGENDSVSLNLTATASAAVPPGSVTVEVTVVNASGTVAASVALSVPRPLVRTSPGTFVVTGPSVASGPPSLPSWFVPAVVFVPALALVVGVVTYRWWRTRKWTRR